MASDGMSDDRKGKLLYRSAADGDGAGVSAMLRAGAPADWRYPLGGNSALHRAAGAGDVAMCTDLAEAGGDVRGRADTGSTVLHWAAENGRLEAVAWLLTTDAARDVLSVNEDGDTPIRLAEAKGFGSIARMLSETADKLAADAATAGEEPAAAAVDAVDAVDADSGADIINLGGVE